MATPTHSPDQEPNSSSPNPEMADKQPHDDETTASPSESQTLTLNLQQNLDPQIPHDELSLGEDRDQLDADEVTELDLSIQDPKFSSSSVNVAWIKPATSGSRRGPKRKKMLQRRAAQEKKSRKKLEILVGNFKPIPFVPAKTLDFSNYENLLKRLGLWDFVHIEFDRHIRTDLIVQLIVNYCPANRGSYVNGAKVAVNRADLARALKLPVKKDKVTVFDSLNERPESEESIGFMEDLVSNWVLLHEDTWMMPDEVLNWTKVIKEGHFEKVDWASLIWFMVEKELTLAPQLTNCYYASHLQWLIRSQKVELLMGEPKVEVDGKEVDAKEEQEEIGGDVKMIEANDLDRLDLDEQKIELSLGQENVDKGDAEKEKFGDQNVMEFEECKGEVSEQRLFDGEENDGENFLRRCNLDDEVTDLGYEEEREKQEELEERGDEGQQQEEDQDRGFHLSPNELSENLIQAMETEEIPFSSGLQLHDHSSGDFLSRGETHMIPGGSSFYGIANKREIGHENDIFHHALDSGNKRLRSYGSFSNKSSQYDMCMEQMQHYMGKARMLYEEKEQAHGELSMNQQILLNELQERDHMIELLHKTKYEEKQKSEADVCRLERELYMMRNLLLNYRKALKETHKAFAEYRARYPQHDEPLYKDVSGSGGLVLSSTELERLRLKQEEERMNRMMIEKKIKDFEVGWIGNFDGHRLRLEMFDSRLLDAEKTLKLFKDSFDKDKVLKESEQSELAPNE